MEMVKYWKIKEAVQAKVTTNKDGALIMKMEGEDYDFPGFPRGHLLFGSLSKLKHEIKNQIFNANWWKLERGESKEKIISDIKTSLDEIEKITNTAQFDIIPPDKMVMPVREIWRAFTALEKYSHRVEPLKRAICYILSEDDAFRFRVQWIVQIFNPSAWWFKLFFCDPIKMFERALTELENGEVIGDMKDRITLLRRILLVALEDPNIRFLFKKLCQEVNWNKLKLSDGDKYHFRGKYFKVDLALFEY